MTLRSESEGEGEGEGAARTCAGCGGPLPSGSNRKRTTCSSACRQKRYRDGAGYVITPEDRAAIDRVNRMFKPPGSPVSPDDVREHVLSTVVRT